MKHFLTLFMASLLVLGLQREAIAIGCMAADVQPPPSVGEQFKLNQPGRLRMTFAYSYSDTDKYYNGESRDHAVERDVEPSTLRNEFAGIFEYDLTERWSLLTEVPFLYVNQNRTGPTSEAVNGSMNANGVGDIRLLGRYWLTEDNDTFNLYGAAGIRVPTGEGDEKFVSEGGNLITKDFAAQTGTGNAAGIVELGGFGRVDEHLQHFFQLRYIFTPSTNTEGNNFRNELSGNGPEKNSDSDAMSWRLGLALPIERFSLTAAVSGAWVPYDDVIGQTAGFRRAGVVMFAEPGIVWSPVDSVTLNASVPITFYRKLQLAGANIPDYIFQTSVTVSF